MSWRLLVVVRAGAHKDFRILLRGPWCSWYSLLKVNESSKLRRETNGRGLFTKATVFLNVFRGNWLPGIFLTEICPFHSVLHRYWVHRIFRAFLRGCLNCLKILISGSGGATLIIYVKKKL